MLAEMLPTVIERDCDIDNGQQAELKMREAVGELTKIRKKIRRSPTLRLMPLNTLALPARD